MLIIKQTEVQIIQFFAYVYLFLILSLNLIPTGTFTLKTTTLISGRLQWIREGRIKPLVIPQIRNMQATCEKGQLILFLFSRITNLHTTGKITVPTCLTGTVTSTFLQVLSSALQQWKDQVEPYKSSEFWRLITLFSWILEVFQ